MASIGSNVQSFFARLLKILMVFSLLPLTIGLWLGVLEQLEITIVAGDSLRHWMGWGFVTYVWCHLLLYRPVGFFQASHKLFSAVAGWLFGGQVGTVASSAGKEKGKGKEKEQPSTAVVKSTSTDQGSTLVAFSPYVIPFYAICLCIAGWALRKWKPQWFFIELLLFCLGMAMAFHWIMTADALQQQRSRWHIETYLLAVELVFILTLLIATACLPWITPEFSFGQALATSLSHTQQLYSTTIQQLFF